MKKYGFLFGAGAELAYNMPSGGQFALGLFREETSKPKEKLKEMLNSVKRGTSYSGEWLPHDYRDRRISSFGDSVFQNIIKSTVKHKRQEILSKISSFDDIAKMIECKNNVNSALEKLLNDRVDNVVLNQEIEYKDAFKKGNELFKSHYFSALLIIYIDYFKSEQEELRKILLSIMQLQLGALSEDLAQDINNNPFVKKDKNINLLAELEGAIRLDYNVLGVSGLEFILKTQNIDTSTPDGQVIQFARLILEEIYASVLDYQALIDAHWHYLYNPSSDWAKFCKIVIFLLTVHQYITECEEKSSKHKNGYYDMLKNALNNNQYEATAIATTNYTEIIKDILGESYPVTYLNGSVADWYDPYLNKIGKKEDFDNDDERHIVVPLLFTQSGTKPITSIQMSERYVKVYQEWQKSEAIVVVGFGFNEDDEHINNILRTLVNDKGKKLKIVTSDTNKVSARDLAKKLKVVNHERIDVILVDQNGKSKGKPWTECI